MRLVETSTVVEIGCKASWIGCTQSKHGETWEQFCSASTEYRFIGIIQIKAKPQLILVRLDNNAFHLYWLQSALQSIASTVHATEIGLSAERLDQQCCVTEHLITRNTFHRDPLQLGPSEWVIAERNNTTTLRFWHSTWSRATDPSRRTIVRTNTSMCRGMYGGAVLM